MGQQRFQIDCMETSFSTLQAAYCFLSLSSASNKQTNKQTRELFGECWDYLKLRLKLSVLSKKKKVSDEWGSKDKLSWILGTHGLGNSMVCCVS